MINSNIIKLLSNYGSKLWSMFSIFIFVPLYIKLLGIENYAVIGFYTLLLGIISFADSGMSSAITKEFSLDKEASYKYSVFRNVEKLYLGICVSIILLIFISSKFIAKEWLNSETISISTLAYYVALIGIGATLQLLSSLYFGALFGLGEQVKANLYQMGWILFRSGIVLLVLLVKPSLEVFFIWQIISNLLYILILRGSMMKCLRTKDKLLNNYLKRIPDSVLKYVGGMTVIAIITAINTQSDKIITSSMFSLKEFGYYNVSSILSQVPVLFATPLALFIFPIFSKFSDNRQEELKITFAKSTYLLSIIVIPIFFLLIYFPAEILKIWNGSIIDKNNITILVRTVRLLSIGSLFLSFQLPLFYLLLSKGKTKYSIYQGIFQVILGLPLLYIFAKKNGIYGVPFSWIIINIGAYVYLTYIVFSSYIKDYFLQYLFKVVLLPTLVNFLIISMVYVLYEKIGGFSLLYMLLGVVVSILGCICIDNIIRKETFYNIKYLYDFPR